MLLLLNDLPFPNGSLAAGTVLDGRTAAERATIQAAGGAVVTVADGLGASVLRTFLALRKADPATPSDRLTTLLAAAGAFSAAPTPLLVSAFYTGLLALTSDPQVLLTLTVTNPFDVPLPALIAWSVGARSIAGAPGIVRASLSYDDNPTAPQGNNGQQSRGGGAPSAAGEVDITVSGVSGVSLLPGSRNVELSVSGVDFGSGATTLAVVGTGSSGPSYVTVYAASGGA